jgi:hypothetical protein
VPDLHVDPRLARLVAAALADAPAVTTDPRVDAAYAALSEQARALFAALTGDRARRPVRVVFTRCRGPYRNADELSESVRRDRLLEVFPAAHERARRHPRLDTSIGGAHDCLRAVHDIVSHGWLRHSFDRDGEFTAWTVEDRMYSGLARCALATELHAQHSALWTSGDLAPYKATLLHPELLRASLAAGTSRTDPAPGLGGCRAPHERKDPP